MKYYLITYHFDTSLVGPHLYAKMIEKVFIDGGFDFEIITEDLSHNSNLERYVPVSKKYTWPVRKINYPWRSIRYYHKLKSHQKVNRIIVINNLFSAFYATYKKHQNDVIVAIAHDDYYTYPNKNQPIKRRILLNLYRRMERYVLKKGDYIFYCSKSTMSSLLNFYGVNSSSRHKLLYPGINLKNFVFSEKKPIHSDLIRILFVKKDWVRGGLPMLYDALGSLKDLRFELSIVGPSQSEISFLQKDNFANVRHQILGQVNHDDIIELFHSHDIFCLPSQKEAFGISVIEALACGIPVVVSDQGGLKEASGGNDYAWIVDPLNIENLSHVIRECIDSKNERIRKSLAGRKYVERNFSGEELRKQLLQFFSSLQDSQK